MYGNNCHGCILHMGMAEAITNLPMPEYSKSEIKTRRPGQEISQ